MRKVKSASGGAAMIEWIVKAALGPITSIAEKFIDSTVDKAKLRAGVEQRAVEADTAFRTSALETIAFRIPFFILFTSHAVYAATIVLDSYAAWNGFFAPLELPTWYKENFQWVLMGLTGVGPFILRRK